ncbi:TolC family outer membrane protein [soil metagenome]
MKRSLISLLLVTVSVLRSAQTTPIKPQTPDVKIPPVVAMPTLEAGVKPLSLSEAVTIALANQPSLKVARANVKSAEGAVQVTGAGLNPQLSLTAGATRNDTFRGQGTSGTTSTSNSNSLTAGLNVTQLLFDFGRTRTAVRQQKALEKASHYTLNTAENDLTLNTRVAYFDLVQNVQLVGTAQQNLANVQRQYDQANARLESGLGAPSDFIRAKTALADAVLSLETARNTETTSRISLAQQLGIDPRTPIQPDVSASLDLKDPSVDEVNSLVTNALRDRPEMRDAQQRVFAAGLGVAVAKLNNAPTVNLTGNLNARGSNDPFQTQTGAIGVSVTWTFGDGGRTSGLTKQAEATVDLAKANLETASLNVIGQVNQAYTDIKTAQLRSDTADTQVANAAELVRISEGRYSGGIGTFLEVRDAQSSLYSAQRNLLAAKTDLQRANARLQRAIGASIL